MTAGSKTVEEAEDVGEESRPGLPLAAVLVKRRRLELARIDVTHQLELVRVDARREMLRRALEALDQELERLI